MLVVAEVLVAVTVIGVVPVGVEDAGVELQLESISAVNSRHNGIIKRVIRRHLEERRISSVKGRRQAKNMLIRPARETAESGGSEMGGVTFTCTVSPTCCAAIGALAGEAKSVRYPGEIRQEE